MNGVPLSITTESGEDVRPYELSSLCSGDGGKRLYFYPLGKIVDGHYQALYLSQGEWERTEEVDSPFTKRPGGHDLK